MNDFLDCMRKTITGPEPKEPFELTLQEFANKLVKEYKGYKLLDLFMKGEWKIAQRMGLVKVNKTLVTGQSWKALVNHLKIVESV